MPYIITGGIAVAAWGRVRATFDIDIVIEIKEEKISPLMDALRELSKAGYIDKKMAKQALRDRGEFNFIDPQTGLKIDFWVRKDEPFAKNEFDRRVSKNIKGQKIYFISPEDLILRKLQWHKLSEISKHLEDIESILKISKVDLNYLKIWAEKQSTIKILNKLL
ncbi:hypothetical protein AMJ49_04505 [Parcubacteria bacterium DG_74_2]|nr:MAG: hypothetical protein AMJ49_04505 [Parcubacteria bacterium DG_74_2]